MRLFAAVAVLLTFTALAVADDKPDVKTVRVYGTADVKVVPDRAVIEVGVEKRNTSAIAAKRLADNAARKILASLRSNGINDRNIQTTFLSLRPEINEHKGVRTTYFVAEQTMSVTVRDVSRLDALLQALVEAGGNRIDSIQYETSDLRKYRDQARDLAVKAAHEKAEALAKALGQSIGKARSIEEVQEPERGLYGYNIQVSAEAGFAGRSGGGPSISAGQTTISASVIVSFDLI
jgi:uncharacterized protein